LSENLGIDEIKFETVTQEQDEEERKGMCRIRYPHDEDCKKCNLK
jgi:hypothetical protein